MSIEENDPLGEGEWEESRGKKIRGKGKIDRSIDRSIDFGEGEEGRNEKEESLREDRSMNTSRRSLGRLDGYHPAGRREKEGEDGQDATWPPPLSKYPALKPTITLFESR